MTLLPLFDSRCLALKRQQRRFSPASPFLDTIAASLSQRLSFFQRSFPTVLVIGAWPELMDRLDLGSPSYITLHARPLKDDSDSLNLPPGPFDAVFHVMELHSTTDIPGVLAQINTVLKPDGLFMGMCLGENTFHPFREALYSLEEALTHKSIPRFHPLLTLQEAGALLQRTGYALPVVDVESYELPFSNLEDLTGFLRRHGWTNALTARSRCPLPRDLYTALTALFPCDIRLDVLYLAGWRASPHQQKPLRPGQFTTSFQEVL